MRGAPASTITVAAACLDIVPRVGHICHSAGGGVPRSGHDIIPLLHAVGRTMTQALRLPTVPSATGDKATKRREPSTAELVAVNDNAVKHRYTPLQMVNFTIKEKNPEKVYIPEKVN